MALTSDQVLHSLMSYYQSRGKDYTFLLGDPIFRSQPLEAQVEFLKNNVNNLSAHAHAQTGFTKSERAHVLAGAATGAVTVGLGSLAAAIPSLVALPERRTRLLAAGAAAVFGGIAGAMVGATGGAMTASAQRDKREALRAEMSATASNPTTSNVIGMLSSTHPLTQGQSSVGGLLKDRFRSEIQSKITPHALIPKTVEVARNNHAAFGGVIVETGDPSNPVVDLSAPAPTQ